ncbi:hypothetical protein [Pectobacterium polaris]|uniref:hypothetical protein n=1 Tax=Pectobacterium polaris TaxID=2042057 RepID=UPI0032E4DAFB
MHPNCIQEVEIAIGRKLTKKETDGIETTISYHLRELAREDRQRFSSLSQQDRLMEAAQRAMAAHTQRAEKIAERRALNMVAQVKNVEALTERAAVLGGKAPFHKALFERLRQLDVRVRGERAAAFSEIVDTINAVEPRFLGLFDNPVATKAFIYEVYGTNTGNPVAAKAAKAWNQQIEGLRQRANSAGMDIGKLDYGYVPQPHDLTLMVKAGKEKWTDFILPTLDRSRYLNEDGTAMDTGQMRDFLGKAYDTITTQGNNKLEPGQVAMGSRASKGDESHRQIHFNGADSYLKYMDTYGRGTVFEGMQGHIFGITKDIALIEEMGPSPSRTFDLLRDTATSKDAIALRTNTSSAREFGATPEMVWDTLNGSLNMPVDARFADINQGIRNLLTSTKLVRAFLSSITDVPTLMLSSAYHNLPMGKTMVNTLRSFSSDYRQDAARLGLATDSIISDMSRFHGEKLTQGWTGKLASATMRATLLEGWTNAIRRGFSVTMMSKIASMSRNSWSVLDQADRTLMMRRGITESDWAMWQQATPETFKGQPMLTPRSIRAIGGADDLAKNSAISKLLGFINDESEFASLGPDIMARSAMMQGTQRGTVGGELLRHFMLFKSFSFGMMSRHLRRVSEIQEGTGKLAYSASLLVGTTLFGALAIHLKDIADGKDPRDMFTPKFGVAAFLQGGGMGIVGDMFYTGMGGDSRGGQPNWMNLLGPVFGTGADAVNVTLGNATKAALGKENNAAADLLRFTKQNAPGVNFMNLWYTKAAFDHAFYNQMMEEASPGYLRRMKERARKDWNQRFWWEPGDATPDRAPDLSRAFRG